LASLAANKFSSTSVISIIHIHRWKLQYKFISTETWTKHISEHKTNPPNFPNQTNLIKLH
jgi:hypothetical protein